VTALSGSAEFLPHQQTNEPAPLRILGPFRTGAGLTLRARPAFPPLSDLYHKTLDYHPYLLFKFIKPQPAGLVAEVVLTFFFLLIILGATDSRAPQGLAPIAIGLGLTLIHLIGIPVTGVSVNPARSTGPALFVGGWALQQLWLFWVAPLLGAALAGIVYPLLAGNPKKSG